jgi:succinate dehydrogenase / fumarate reductase, cytochrome b subunit
MASKPAARARPLSPHLSIWRWKVHMAASIFHRVTGNAMAFGAAWIFAWWLFAAASGRDSYALVHHVATGWFGILVGIGFTWTFFQHLANGIRHLVMDSGRGFDLATNKSSAILVFVAGAALTVLTWAIIFTVKGF